MPTKVFTGFLSCSESKSDGQLVDFFEKLIESCGIVPRRAVKEPIGRPVPEKIVRMIAAEDCLIGLLTRRHKVADVDTWLPPDFVTSEVGIAYGMRKPILVFAEIGVDVSGLTPYVTDYVRFDRSDLLEVLPRVVKALNNLNEDLFQQYGSIFTASHLRESIDSQLVIDWSGYACLRNEIEARALIDRLPSIEHELSIPANMQVEFKDLQLEFYPIFSERKEVSLRHELRVSESRALIWHVIFEPPLESRNVVRYGFIYRYVGIYPLVREDAQALVDSGRYYLDKPLGAEGWFIVAPTYRFHFEVRFPEYYPIYDPAFEVTLGPTKARADYEEKQIRGLDGFKARTFAHQWALSLDVERPQIGLLYKIVWQPPTRKEFEKLRRSI